MSKTFLDSFSLCIVIRGFPVRVIKFGVRVVLEIDQNLAPFLDVVCAWVVVTFKAFHCTMVHAKVYGSGNCLFFVGGIALALS